MTQPIEFFYWPTPNGWKISIAMYEFDLPHRVNLVNINRGEQHTPEYQAISPGGKMPAIVDPDGPDGKPISIFESGAILLYLARKTGKFYGQTERERIEIDQWLMWQMGGIGPIAGQSHHFMNYAPQMDPPQVIPYAQKRFYNEVRRLYSILDKHLEGRDFVVGDFSIADMALWPWVWLWDGPGQQQDISDLPHLQRWLDQCYARPGVAKGHALHLDLRTTRTTAEARNNMFGRD
jgi:GST-like protein